MAQKYLIRGLKIFNCSEETILGIMILLETPEMQDEMMDWMVENRNATEPELFSKAVDIRDQNIQVGESLRDDLKRSAF